MTLVIGTDEAGYGPNLGPLVVAASVWQVDAAPAAAEATLARALALAAHAADPAVDLAPTRVTPLWTDSKQVYRGGNKTGGLMALEAGVLTALGIANGAVPSSWPAFAVATGIDDNALPPPEWPVLQVVPLPRVADAEACAARSTRIATALADAGVSLERITCRIVHPAEFNGHLTAGLNKSDILSAVTLTLAADTRRRAEAHAPVMIWCDRHGGRKHYAAVVARYFDCPLVQPIEETPTRSAYELLGSDCRIEFCVGGEARGPVALASMTAKYIRELAMEVFNRFWSERLPGLAPTAGYPVDATRWRREAAVAIRAAGITDEELWRQA
jgi:hypothetical protein